MWKDGNWSCMLVYHVFVHGIKATKIYPPDNLTQWIITQPKGCTSKCLFTSSLSSSSKIEYSR